MHHRAVALVISRLYSNFHRPWRLGVCAVAAHVWASNVSSRFSGSPGGCHPASERQDLQTSLEGTRCRRAAPCIYSQLPVKHMFYMCASCLWQQLSRQQQQQWGRQKGQKQQPEQHVDSQHCEVLALEHCSFSRMDSWGWQVICLTQTAGNTTVSCILAHCSRLRHAGSIMKSST